MPFKSLSQMRLLYATHPKIASKFAHETTKKQMEKLPKILKKKKK